MAWYHLFAPRPTTAQVVRLAHTLARTHHTSVLAAVRIPTAGMSRFETRGYVRVKAAVQLRREVKRLIHGQRELGDWAYDILVNHSVEAVVQLVCGELMRVRAPARRAA